MSKFSKNPYIIEGKAAYVPRLTGHDKFGRHSITIIPDDQSIFETLNSEWDTLVEGIFIKNSYTLDTDYSKPRPPSWKEVPFAEKTGITFCWKDDEIANNLCVVCDTDNNPLSPEIPDATYQECRVKCSFELRSYFFVGDDGTPVFGVKSKLRKLMVVELATIQDFNDPSLTLEVDETLRELTGGMF